MEGKEDDDKRNPVKILEGAPLETSVFSRKDVK